MIARLPTLLSAAVVSGVLVLGACSDDPAPKTVAPEPSPSSSSPSPTPTVAKKKPKKKKAKPPQMSLLSGRKGRRDHGVIAAKIDNTGSGRPLIGVQQADVVYVEQVEGGVTRLAAVYSSTFPDKVGPVRSARITDIELLRQYGSTGLVYSGSQRRLSDNLRASKLQLASNDASGRGFARSGARPAPYNVIGDMSSLRRRIGKTSKPKVVGYTFGKAPKGGSRVQAFTASYPSARVGGSWAPRKQRWMLSIDGRPALSAGGSRLRASTFVVQFADVKPSIYHDVNGANTPKTVTVGQGRTLVFRNGKVYEGRWGRKKPWNHTKLTIGGKKAVFAPGQVWFALVKRGAPVSVSR